MKYLSVKKCIFLLIVIVFSLLSGEAYGSTEISGISDKTLDSTEISGIISDKTLDEISSQYFIASSTINYLSSVTNLVVTSPYSSHLGVDGRDFTVTWTPSISPDVVCQKIFILPAEMSLPYELSSLTPVAIFYNNSACSWTGDASLAMDSNYPRQRLTAGEYRVYVISENSEGYGSYTSEYIGVGTPAPPTEITALDNDLTYPGIDGRDFTATWIPSNSPGVICQEIYVLPVEISLDDNYSMSTPVKVFNNNTTCTWTGDASMTMDSLGTPLKNGDYTIYIGAIKEPWITWEQVDIVVGDPVTIQSIVITSPSRTGMQITTTSNIREITRAELCKLLTLSFSLYDSNATTNFSDVPSNNYYYHYIASANNAGLIDGYPDGTFRPDYNLTRAEYATIITRSLGYTNNQKETIATDMSGHWAQGYIKEALNSGLMCLYPDNSFKPNELMIMDPDVQLIAIIRPSNSSDKSIVWRSSDGTIATVGPSGLVIGKKSGAVVISATSSDGTKTATYNVQVIEGSGDISASFTDTNFKQTIWEWLGHTGTQGAFTKQDLINNMSTQNYYLDLSFRGINSLSGLENFEGTGLTHLDCWDNNLSSLPTLPTSLKELNCSNNNLNSLPTLPNGLTKLYCGDNQLTNLSLLPSGLKQILCFNNQLSSLPSLPSSLTDLLCSNNKLSSLPTLPTSLVWLDCSNNQLTNLPTLPNNLISLYCSNNYLNVFTVGMVKTTLDASSASTKSITPQYRYICLSPTKELNVGGTNQLTGTEIQQQQSVDGINWTNTGYGDKSKFTYTSSDNSVATVNVNGLITAHTAGSCHIYAKYSNIDSEFTKLIIPLTVNGFSIDVDASHSTSLINAPLNMGTNRTITVTLNDSNGNQIKNTHKDLNIAITIKNTVATTAEQYTVDGQFYRESTVIPLSATSNDQGQISFDVLLPPTIDTGDGISIQVKTITGSNIGLSFSYPVIDQCFIATAAFGSKFQPAVVLLRHFRDQYLLTNSFGKAFVTFYYHNSPPVAAYIATSEPLKALVRLILLPVIAVVYAIFHPVIGIGCVCILWFILVKRRKLVSAG